MAAGDTLRRITQQDQLILDSSGNVVGVKNPNAGGADLRYDATTLVRKVASTLRPLRIIPAGDSITQNNSTFATSLWQFGAGYAEASIAAAGPRYRLVRNAGISGNTAAALLARLGADVIAYSPDVCPLMIGTNDLASGMSSAAYATMFSTIEQIVLALLKAGILPVIVTPPPKDSAPTEARNAQWFYYALAQYYGLPLVDMFRVLVNPQSGNYQASYTSDGTHPTPAGITPMITAAASVLGNLTNASCPPYLAAVSEAGFNAFANRFRNGTFSNGVASGPDGWTVNSTGATPSLVAATLPYTGNTFTYNKTVAAGAYALAGGAPSSASGSFSDNDTMQMNVRLKVGGLTPSTAAGFQMDLQASTGAHLRTNNWVQNGDYVFSWEFVVPAGTTTLAPQLFVSDIAQYEVNNWTLFNVTKANAIWQPGLQF